MSRITLLFCVAVLFASCASSGNKRLTKQELGELLGPESHTTLRWSRTDGPDFTVYYGEAVSPSSGGVGFYLGMAPSFEPATDSTAHRGRLGAFDVVWHRTHREDGSLYQTTLITLPDHSSVHAWVYGPRESDLDALIHELSALPQFRQRASQLHQ